MQPKTGTSHHPLSPHGKQQDRTPENGGAVYRGGGAGEALHHHSPLFSRLNRLIWGASGGPAREGGHRPTGQSTNQVTNSHIMAQKG